MWLGARVRMMNGAAEWVDLPGPQRSDLADRGLDEPGLPRRRALRAEDGTGVGVDHERENGPVAR